MFITITTNQPRTKSNPNHNPRTKNPTTRQHKQHAIVNIQLDIIVTCATYPDKFILDNVAPFVLNFGCQCHWHWPRCIIRRRSFISLFSTLSLTFNEVRAISPAPSTQPVKSRCRTGRLSATTSFSSSTSVAAAAAAATTLTTAFAQQLGLMRSVARMHWWGLVYIRHTFSWWVGTSRHFSTVRRYMKWYVRPSCYYRGRSDSLELAGQASTSPALVTC